MRCSDATAIRGSRILGDGYIAGGDCMARDTASETGEVVTAVGTKFETGDLVRVRPNVNYLEGKLRIGDLGFLLRPAYIAGIGYFRFPMVGDFYLMMESVERVIE